MIQVAPEKRHAANRGAALMIDRRRYGTWWIAVLLALPIGARTARAGGGPENVFLVVNATSWASLTVANHFIQLRAIPPINVLYLNWTRGIASIDGETMRRQILGPTLEAMDKRGLYHQIDYILYSSDLPCTVNLSADYQSAGKIPAQASPTCSINSATYLWQLVMLKNPEVMSSQVNSYVRSFTKTPENFVRQTDEPTRGFRSWYGWNRRGELQEAGGQPYMLSTMLAVTSGRGNSVRQAIDYLTRSAAADGTFPKGTIYFTSTQDKRSTRRAPEVAAAVEQLAKLGVRAQVVPTRMPQNCPDVAGLISGVADFNWAATRSTILPGAICDNLTSFGGVMTERGGQTPLTEFLAYGAAGSAGTVIEPYLIAEKFASPNIFVHYARGCTLAEAYYQSIYAPAQVLIVGDALCRPWANIPQVAVAGVEPGAKVSATLSLKPQATFARGGKVERFVLFVDGRRVGSAKPDENLAWDSTTESDGYHELRVAAIDDGPIETQGRKIIPVTVDNQGRAATMTTTPKGTVRWDQTLTVDVKAPGTKQIYVLNNGRVLGRIVGDQGQLKVNPRVLGLGPVGLQAIALAGTAYRDRVIPPPVSLTVESAPPLPALPRQKLAAGMMLQLADKQVVPVQETTDPGWLALAGVGPNQPYAFQGYFEVDSQDVYQFQLWHEGALALAVDGRVLYSVKEGNYDTLRYVPVALAKGQHRLTVSGRTAANTRLRILFGGPGALSLNGRDFGHPAR
jgi:uncharacterized protein (TIGR03790 family)